MSGGCERILFVVGRWKPVERGFRVTARRETSVRLEENTSDALGCFQLVFFERFGGEDSTQRIRKSTLEAGTKSSKSPRGQGVVECEGLCVTLYSITDISGGTVLAGEGCVCFDVSFKVVPLLPLGKF